MKSLSCLIALLVFLSIHSPTQAQTIEASVVWKKLCQEDSSDFGLPKERERYQKLRKMINLEEEGYLEVQERGPSPFCFVPQIDLFAPLEDAILQAQLYQNLDPALHRDAQARAKNLLTEVWTSLPHPERGEAISFDYLNQVVYIGYRALQLGDTIVMQESFSLLQKSFPLYLEKREKELLEQIYLQAKDGFISDEEHKAFYQLERDNEVVMGKDVAKPSLKELAEKMRVAFDTLLKNISCPPSKTEIAGLIYYAEQASVLSDEINQGHFDEVRTQVEKYIRDQAQYTNEAQELFNLGAEAANLGLTELAQTLFNGKKVTPPHCPGNGRWVGTLTFKNATRSNEEYDGIFTGPKGTEKVTSSEQGEKEITFTIPANSEQSPTADVLFKQILTHKTVGRGAIVCTVQGHESAKRWDYDSHEVITQNAKTKTDKVMVDIIEEGNKLMISFQFTDPIPGSTQIKTQYSFSGGCGDPDHQTSDNNFPDNFTILGDTFSLDLSTEARQEGKMSGTKPLGQQRWVSWNLKYLND